MASAPDWNDGSLSLHAANPRTPRRTLPPGRSPHRAMHRLSGFALALLAKTLRPRPALEPSTTSSLALEPRGSKHNASRSCIGMKLQADFVRAGTSVRTANVRHPEAWLAGFYASKNMFKRALQQFVHRQHALPAPPCDAHHTL